MHKEEDTLNHTEQLKIKSIARILCLLLHLETFNRTSRTSNESHRVESINKYQVIPPAMIKFAEQ